MNYTLTLKDGEKFTITDEQQNKILEESSGDKKISGMWLSNRYVAFSAISSIVENYEPEVQKPSNAPQLPQPKMSGNRTPQENLTRFVKSIKQGIIDAGGDPMKNEFYQAVLKKKNVKEIIDLFRRSKTTPS